MKVSFSLLFVLMVSFVPASFAAEPHTARSSDLAPAIGFRETTFDFGTLLEAESAVHTFVFKNTGNAPLVIKRIKTTCGCTTVDYAKGEIAPDAEGNITLQVNTSGYGGKTITKSVTVYTNDPKATEIELRMAGNVEAFADIEPKSIKLIGFLGETVRAKVEIIPTESYPFHIVGAPETGKDTYRCELEERDGKYILTAENLVEKPMIYFDSVVLKTDRPEKPEIKIRVIGKIKEAYPAEKGD